MNDPLKLIVFSLDEQCYGLPLHSVTKVLRAVEVTPIPKASNFIIGVINVHGEIIPVLDIRKLVGLRQKAICLSDRFVVTQIFSRTLIVVVDSVSKVTEYFRNEIASVDCSLPENTEHVNVKHILKRDDDLICILDIEKILSYSDLQVIEKLTVNGSTTT